MQDREREIRNTINGLNGVGVSMRRLNICPLGRNGDETILKKTMAWNFSELKKDMSPHIRIA